MTFSSSGSPARRKSRINIPLELRAAADSSVSAFRLGRCVNRLSWHISQGFMLSSRLDIEAAVTLMEWTVENLRLLKAPPELCKMIENRTAWVKRSFPGIWKPKDVAFFDQDFEFADSVFDGYMVLEDEAHKVYFVNGDIDLDVSAKILKKRIPKFTEKFRRRVEEWIDRTFRSELTSFRFGVCLDQGLCPPNSERQFIDRKEGILWEAYCHLKNGPSRGTKRRVQSSFPHGIPTQYVLTRKSREPGELLPASTWGVEVQSLGHQCGIPGDTLKKIHACFGNEQRRLRAIDRIIRATERILAPANESSQTSAVMSVVADDSTSVTWPINTDVASKRKTVIWYHGLDKEPPPKYIHGPIVGTQKKLAEYILTAGTKDPRQLRHLANKRIWFRQINRTAYEAFFADEHQFNAAKRRKDGLG